LVRNAHRAAQEAYVKVRNFKRLRDFVGFLAHSGNAEDVRLP